MQADLVVTRHKALVALLHERGVVGPDVPVIEHVGDPSALDGRVVVGVLPLHLAARCREVWEVPLQLQPADRGRELDLPRLREVAGAVVRYRVTAL